MKRLRNFVCMVAAVVLVSLTIELLMNGMPLIGAPEPKNVAAVIVSHPVVSPEDKRFDDEENIELACNLTNFLRYSLLEKSDGTNEAIIAITYEMKNGETAMVSANRETVWWKGKAYKLKDDNTFVNLAEGIFFWPEVIEEDAR